jgi:hypothetical protein
MVVCAMVVCAMDDESEARIRELERKLRWAQEDNARVWKLLDDALACLRDSNARVKAYAEARTAGAEARVADAQAEARAADADMEARVAAAHAETVAAEQRLARAVLNARAPWEKLH